MIADNPKERSRIAILGTLAELHTETPAYDLRVLRRLVKTLQPDLLLAEIHPDDWNSGELGQPSLVYREVLVPLSRRTDIIIVPVSNSRGWELSTPRGKVFRKLRTFATNLLNSQMRWMQRFANGPDEINSGWFGWICDRTCTVIAWICGPQAQREWKWNNQVIVDNVQEALRRDPGRRVLVTVDCRRRHKLEKALRGLPDVELVDYHYL